MNLGIFGGSFNPIHLGHLLLAETAREQLALDRVVFIPASVPPHKGAKGLLPGAVRLKLVQLATRDHPHFAVSDIELQRSGPSYTIDTVKLLKTQAPEAKLFLLIGEDMLTVKWASWAQLKRMCTIVAARRPTRTKARKESGVVWLEMPRVEISSSDIRARARAGRSLRYLVPPAVGRYITQHHLYRSRS